MTTEKPSTDRKEQMPHAAPKCICEPLAMPDPACPMRHATPEPPAGTPFPFTSGLFEKIVGGSNGMTGRDFVKAMEAQGFKLVPAPSSPAAPAGEREQFEKYIHHLAGCGGYTGDSLAGLDWKSSQHRWRDCTCGLADIMQQAARASAGTYASEELGTASHCAYCGSPLHCTNILINGKPRRLHNACPLCDG